MAVNYDVSAQPLKNMTVMVVEDDDDILYLANLFLKSAGCEVQTFLDPQEAERALDTQHFDLLFTDIRMPSPLNGLELANLARQKNPDMAILIATGLDRDFFQELWMHQYDVLEKPYDRTQLIEAVLATLAKEHRPISACG